MKNDPMMNEIKNKFRGIVSVFRSKQFVKDKKISDSSILRQSIKSLYMDCRVKVPEDSFSEVLSWLNKSIRTQIPEYYTTPIGYEELRLINTGVESTELSREIAWIVNRLSAEYQNINIYLSYKKEIENLILLGKYQQAIDFLVRKEKELGVTLWSVQLKISLLQTLKGLEGQKQYTAEVRNVWPGGILSYITYFTSVRNEERTSLVKFNDDMDSKLNGANIDNELVAHLKYHLMAELPIDDKKTAELLQIEQLGTIYDLYETFTAVTLKTVNFNSRVDSKDFILKGLKKLSKINDPRLIKAIFHITGSYETTKLKSRDSTLPDTIISGDNNGVINILRKFGGQKSLGSDIWDYIYLGVWLALANRKYIGKKVQPHNLHRLIGSALSEQNMFADINTLIKLSVNYNGLNTFSGINEFLNFILKSSSEYQNLWSPHLIGLHSDYFGIEDISLSSYVKTSFNIEESITSRYWKGEIGKPTSLIEAYSVSLIKNLRLLSENNIEGCLQSLPCKILTKIPQPYRLFFCQIKLYALSKEGLRSDIINLINESVPCSNDIVEIVSFEDILIDFEYEDFASTDNILSAPIALFVAWVKTEDSKLLSYLRIATKKAIKKAGCNKPSELKYSENEQDNSQLIFFLEHICVPQVIDNIRSLKGTKAVLNERQDICRLLLQLDPCQAKYYLTEIESIADELLMEEGKRVVDRTRIYVDMDAHTRWVFKELQEDYERYKDLLDIHITGVQDYKEILDDYLNASNATKTTFVPDNEADAVLLSIVARASNDFLTNPKYGLDYYLSKRIRHQSFIGLIRSHLEFSDLITTRISEDKDFEYNHNWINKFKSLSQCKKDEFNSLLSTFAKDFDDELIHVRDNVFQLNTDDCPTGLIKIDFNIQVMSLLKHFIIETDASFEEFVYYSNTFMWAFLQPSLEKTKKYIKDNLKPSIMHSADKLKANARKLAGSDSAFDDFELTLTDQTAAVQRSLEDVMAWFTPLTGVSVDNVVLSVDKVLNLSIGAALDMLKPFSPNIRSNISNESDIKLHQQGLTFVNDTVFILLDNIKTHSGIKFPKITLNIDVDEDKGTLTISSSNDTKQSERERLLFEINKIKLLIDNGKLGDRAKSEGRSGFIKLAASIDKSDRSNLNFDLNDDGKFYLSITNDLHVAQVPFDEIEVEIV